MELRQSCGLRSLVCRLPYVLAMDYSLSAMDCRLFQYWLWSEDCGQLTFQFHGLTYDLICY